MKPLRIVFLVLGSILRAASGSRCSPAAACSVGPLATQRDDAGYFTTSTQRFHTRTAAITTRDIDLGTPGPDDWWAERDIATVRIRGASATAQPIFIGIARDADVERYLARRTATTRSTDVDYDPFHATYRVHDAGGTATAAPADGPALLGRAQATGLGTRTAHLAPAARALGGRDHERRRIGRRSPPTSTSA